MDSVRPLHPNEKIKEDSHFLRGDIREGLADLSTGALADPDTQLTKFHGIYQQDDRDLRSQRRKEKREKAYIFMARIRVPGGVCTPKQWLDLDRLASSHGNDTLKITTRQAFQLHGIIKGNLKEAIREINGALLDTIAACGDVNRNVMCNPNPHQSAFHGQALATASAISSHLTPRTHAYHEIWLDHERITPEPQEEEPIYGRTYLPRKFKIVVAVPPVNDVDVYAHDLGFIAIIENGLLSGYNVAVGGGLGMAHGKEETFPRLAEVMGFCRPDQALDLAEKVVLVQRDYGDRSNRAHARLKYTIEDRGLAWFRREVEERLGWKLQEPRPFHFDHNGDRYGWVEGPDGNAHFTLFIQNGRVYDGGGSSLRTALRELAQAHQGDFRLTPNQNLILANVAPQARPRLEEILRRHGLNHPENLSGLRLNSLACVALPTCGLALAESERYLPSLLEELETIIEENGLQREAITIRMTGCPNGCARPYLAEIAMVGRAPHKYNVYLGGGFAGDRLNKLYRSSVLDSELAPLLRPIIAAYAQERRSGERFGDFVIRQGYVAPTEEGARFHEDLSPEALVR